MASTASLTAGRSGRVLHLAEEEWKQLNPHGRFTCPLYGPAGPFIVPAGPLEATQLVSYLTAHFNLDEHGPAERLTAPGSRVGFAERDARRA